MLFDFFKSGNFVIYLKIITLLAKKAPGVMQHI